MPELDACPLCRSVVPPGAKQCGDCGADLSPYIELNALAERYQQYVRELIARGELAESRQVLDALPRLREPDAAVLAELEARWHLAAGEFDDARNQLHHLPEDTARELRQELAAREGFAHKAREYYNQALTCARQEELHQAAWLAGQALELAPREPAILTLALKLSLKLGDWTASYWLLARLDALDARPENFEWLETQLPAINRG